MGHVEQNLTFLKQRQLPLSKYDFRHSLSHGGILRQKSKGRSHRPLSTKEPLHLVYKCRRSVLREGSLRGYRSFPLIQKIIKKYAIRFHIKVEQLSVQGDHIHLLIRCPRRAQYHHFFRVSCGQIAQILKKEGLLRTMTDTPLKNNRASKNGTKLWLYRPFSRVIRGMKAYQIIKDYIRLNDCEALGKIKYSKQRLKGLSNSEWQILWSS